MEPIGLPGRVDIGSGHVIAPVLDKDGNLIGLADEHPGKTPGSVCYGSVALEGSSWASDGHTWRLVQREPLTLEPSILCTVCGDHGWIRDGRWVPA